MKIECIGREEDAGPGTELKIVPLKSTMQGGRTVTYKNSTGFYMNHTPEDGERGSFLAWPKASELEVVGDNFHVSFTREDGTVWCKNYYSIIKK